MYQHPPPASGEAQILTPDTGAVWRGPRSAVPSPAPKKWEWTTTTRKALVQGAFAALGILLASFTGRKEWWAIAAITGSTWLFDFLKHWEQGKENPTDAPAPAPPEAQPAP